MVAIVPATTDKYCCYSHGRHCSLYPGVYFLIYLLQKILSYSLQRICIISLLVGWLADVKLGRYQVIKLSALASFLASILYYFTVLNGNKLSIQGNVLYVTTFIVSFGFTGAMLPLLCYIGAMLEASSQQNCPIQLSMGQFTAELPIPQLSMGLEVS